MTNQPDAVAPENSTDDLPMGGMDDASEGAEQGNGISLSQEQAKSAGIHEPMPGDEYTITIKVGDTSNGVSATILDGSAKKSDTPPNDMDDTGQIDDDTDQDQDTDASQEDASNPEDSTPPLAVKPAVKGKFKMKILGPDDMGFKKDGSDT